MNKHILPALLLGALALGACHAAPTLASPVTEVSPEEVRESLEGHAPVLLVSACRGGAFSKGHIEGAIPVEDFRAMIPELSRNTAIILYCSCTGDKAARELAQELLGFRFTRVRILSGGIYAWIRAGYELASESGGTRERLP
jgi:rhodanese-related sulfurtransferase